MYGKTYESMYEGSMIGAGLNVFAVWNYVITKARNGYIEVNPKLLAFTLGGIGCDPKQIEDALIFLQQPDPDSRSKIEDGRRLVKEGQFQYRLVNWEEYNRIRNEEDRREYNRIAQKLHREKLKAEPSQGVPGSKKGRRPKGSRNSGPLPGEAAYVKALKDGASQEELDRLSEGPM